MGRRFMLAANPRMARPRPRDPLVDPTDGHRQVRTFAAVVAALVSIGSAACSTTTVAGRGVEQPDGQDRAPATAGPTQSGPTEVWPAGDLQVRLAPVIELDAPIDVAAIDATTLWVAQRAGLVVPVTDGAVGPPLIDVTDRTTTDGERGLLGIALSPARDLLVVSFTDRDGTSTLEAHAIVDGRPSADGGRTLLRIEQPRANHNGGAVHFGPDGMLYVALGDGGGSGDPLGAGQDRSNPLGAILRLDVRGDGPARIPGDNPLVGVPGADARIVASGLRNPWRFSFDPGTGDLWVGDVGQGRREEIDRVALADLPGADFGWARFEGSLPFDGPGPPAGQPVVAHTPPVHEYDHGPGCAVTGGIVYRGARIPALVGVYLFSDLCDGTIRGLRLDADGRVTEVMDLGVTGRRVVGFAPDAAGEVLVIDLDGRIDRIEPA
jgi:glucose/arabinose dehydrogenase